MLSFKQLSDVFPFNLKTFGLSSVWLEHSKSRLNISKNVQQLLTQSIDKDVFLYFIHLCLIQTLIFVIHFHSLPSYPRSFRDKKYFSVGATAPNFEFTFKSVVSSLFLDLLTLIRRGRSICRLSLERDDKYLASAIQMTASHDMLGFNFYKIKVSKWKNGS